MAAGKEKSQTEKHLCGEKLSRSRGHGKRYGDDSKASGNKQC